MLLAEAMPVAHQQAMKHNACYMPSGCDNPSEGSW